MNLKHYANANGKQMLNGHKFPFGVMKMFWNLT